MTGAAHGQGIGSHRAIPTRRSVMRRTRIIAAALLSAATFAAPASAMPNDPPHTPTRPPVVQTTAPSDETSSGVDWSSAGIGAIAGVGASAIALAGIGGMRHRRLNDSGPVVTR
jgi:hypothetical protein